MKPADLWPKLCRLGKEREDWKSIMLLIELCKCTPFSNATLDFQQKHAILEGKLLDAKKELKLYKIKFEASAAP